MFNPSDLGNFYGSENFYKFPLTPGIVFTDGCHFLMQNGAAWCVTDALVICKMEKKVAREEFVSIKFKVQNGKAQAIYDNGNGKVLYHQEYDSTDLPCDLDFYFENGTLMLTSER